MGGAPLALAFAAGMLATVNPCGFAMLPAYLSYFVGLEEDPAAAGADRTVLRAVAVSAVMTIGQISEPPTLLLLSFILRRFGLKATFGLGIAAWLARYLIFASGANYNWILAGIALHGICHVCLVIVIQLYLDAEWLDAAVLEQGGGQVGAGAQADEAVLDRHVGREVEEDAAREGGDVRETPGGGRRRPADLPPVRVQDGALAAPRGVHRGRHARPRARG